MNTEVLKDILQWDVNSWALALDYWEKKVEWNKINVALELGARKGGLSLWLALKKKNVVCSDLSDTQQVAQELHKKYDVSKYIVYQDIDATFIPYNHHFDLIVLKSILGGIGRNDRFDNQKKVVEEVYKALKPSGVFLFAENLKASFLHQIMRKKFVKWGSEWRYLSPDEMKNLLNQFSCFEIKTNGVIAAFGRTEKQRNILSYMDKYFLNKICPDNWKYIAYGMAVK